MTWIPSGQAFTYFDIIHGADVPLAWPCDGRAKSLGLKFFLQSFTDYANHTGRSVQQRT